MPLKGFGTCLVPAFSAQPDEAPITRPRLLFQPLGLACPRCGKALAVEEDLLIGGSGTVFRVGCYVPLDRGARAGGHDFWDIPEAEARQLAALAVGDAAARRELVKRVKRITKGKTFGEKLDARLHG